MALGAYAILTVSPASLNGLLAGLFLPVAAIACEALYELYAALAVGFSSRRDLSKEAKSNNLLCLNNSGSPSPEPFICGPGDGIAAGVACSAQTSGGADSEFVCHGASGLYISADYFPSCPFTAFGREPGGLQHTFEGSRDSSRGKATRSLAITAKGIRRFWLTLGFSFSLQFARGDSGLRIADGSSGCSAWVAPLRLSFTIRHRDSSTLVSDI